MESLGEDKVSKQNPPKIFKTEDKAAKTRDGFENFASRVGLNNDNSLSASFYAFNLMTRNRIQLEAAYRGSWIVGQVIDTVAEDMTKAGIDITTNEGEEDIKDIYAGMSRLRVWGSLCNGIKWGRLYGGGLAVVQIQGQDLATPLDIETVGEGQFKGLIIYDRWQLNPILTDLIEDGPQMGLPASYQIVNYGNYAQPTGSANGGFTVVHHSRVIRMIGIELPYFQAITEMMWGESILERPWDRLIAFDNATMSSANLIERANNRTVGIEGLREIVAAGGAAQAGLEAQIDMMRLFQTNEGLTVMDKNDTFATTSYSFAGLSELLLQFGQQLSGSFQIPLVKLFGQSPAGLSATGEADIRMYYDSINAQQESRLRAGIQLILQIMWRSTFGKPAPKDMEFSFVPLWQMSAVDKATIAKTNSETIAGAEEAGLISRPSAMKELRDMSKETGLFGNITDEDITQAEEEPPPEPGQPAKEPVAGTASEVANAMDSRTTFMSKLVAFLKKA